MQPLALTEPPAALQQDHFKRDTAGSISEEDLRRVLAAPVFLEPGARLGVVQVSTGYEPDRDLPLSGAPADITGALQDAGLFDGTTEISTEWPADHGVSGLRELAARYRTEYLVLYRHRFVDDSTTNGWGISYLAVLPILFAPARTLRTAGLLEATLFDVKTGTLLFTVFTRVEGERDTNLWHNESKRRQMKEKLLEQAAKKLAVQVVDQARRLAAVQPAGSPAVARGEDAVSAPSQPPAP
jgi:hypothetical protein